MPRSTWRSQRQHRREPDRRVIGLSAETSRHNSCGIATKRVANGARRFFSRKSLVLRAGIVREGIHNPGTDAAGVRVVDPWKVVPAKCRKRPISQSPNSRQKRVASRLPRFSRWGCSVITARRDRSIPANLQDLATHALSLSRKRGSLCPTVAPMPRETRNAR
ncbi:MAG: hypothetical protein KatS3mg114_0469 [Planctomycetaceae bacterium]|nr:MAG: hypothetical protein KatS3mg114_0469 [Planctomycetaceae bacterium]